MVGILLSYWDGLFSGAMLVSGRVLHFFFKRSQGIGLAGILDFFSYMFFCKKNQGSFQWNCFCLLLYHVFFLRDGFVFLVGRHSPKIIYSWNFTYGSRTPRNYCTWKLAEPTFPIQKNAKKNRSNKTMLQQSLCPGFSVSRFFLLDLFEGRHKVPRSPTFLGGIFVCFFCGDQIYLNNPPWEPRYALSKALYIEDVPNFPRCDKWLFAGGSQPFQKVATSKPLRRILPDSPNRISLKYWWGRRWSPLPFWDTYTTARHFFEGYIKWYILRLFFQKLHMTLIGGVQIKKHVYTAGNFLESPLIYLISRDILATKIPSQDFRGIGFRAIPKPGHRGCRWRLAHLGEATLGRRSTAGRGVLRFGDDLLGKMAGELASPR